MGLQRPLQASGVAWYVGIPGSGKTTLATAHAAELVRRKGWPVVCIDSQGVAQLASIPRVASPRDVVEHAWRLRRHCAFIPESDEDVRSIARAALTTGRVVLLIDEAAYWLTAHDRHSPLLRLMRAHRHANVCILLTTQHLSGDVPQEALACAPVLHVFRCESPAALERLERDYRIPPERIASLPRGHFLRIETGFPDSEKRT